MAVAGEAVKQTLLTGVVRGRPLRGLGRPFSGRAGPVWGVALRESHICITQSPSVQLGPARRPTPTSAHFSTTYWPRHRLAQGRR